MKASALLLHLLAVIVALWSLFPFGWAVATSLHPDARNYAEVFSRQPFARDLLNSFAVAALTVVAANGLGALAAYATARRRFAGRRLLLLAFLFVSMFPQIAVLSGLFELVRALGLYNRLGALVPAYLIFTLPFTVWNLSAAMRAVPREIEESAILDGAPPLRALRSIFLPLVAPALASTAILAFIAAWNEFLFALTFTLTERSRTVPVAIGLITGESEHELPWGQIMAASVVVTLPLILLVLAFQKRITSGLMAGATKG